jgi:hypothetical protein
MSIALGVLCHGGIVLAVDNQYSNDPIKYRGKKLFPLKVGTNFTILVAATGRTSAAHKAIEIIEANLSGLTEDASITFGDLKSWIEAALTRLYVEYVDLPPTKKERDSLHCDFLFAVWVRGEGLKLLQSDRNILLDNRTQTSIGTGQYFSRFLHELLFGPYLVNRPTVQEGCSIAAYIVDAAKDYIRDIGKETIIAVLYADGRWDNVFLSDVSSIIESFRDLTRTMRHCLRCLDVDAVGDDQLEIFGTLLMDSVKRFRAGQSRRKELEARRRSYPEEPQGPGLTKGDPSPPPPSPESPEGSDES